MAEDTSNPSKKSVEASAEATSTGSDDAGSATVTRINFGGSPDPDPEGDPQASRTPANSPLTEATIQSFFNDISKPKTTVSSLGSLQAGPTGTSFFKIKSSPKPESPNNIKTLGDPNQQISDTPDSQ